MEKYRKTGATAGLGKYRTGDHGRIGICIGLRYTFSFYYENNFREYNNCKLIGYLFPDDMRHKNVE